MSSYQIKIEERALLDIQQGFDYYEEQQPNLGVRFNNSIFQAFEILRQSPFYQIRYDSFRCLPINKFPFMIHNEVEETSKTIIVYAVINTYRNPSSSWIDKE
jgi:hypothetical protein